MGVIELEKFKNLRKDDIYCGAPFCNVCDVSTARLSSNSSTILIVLYQAYSSVAYYSQEDDDLRPKKKHFRSSKLKFQEEIINFSKRLGRCLFIVIGKSSKLS
ncbi:Uncharacterized protein Fot_25953 [Forsythia ovata]|uniref:Uncharacterized protein n=1 Tax=Forsythia ovata TaxID=205694 RepID=A0ABD1UAH9_9LAMI